MNRTDLRPPNIRPFYARGRWKKPASRKHCGLSCAREGYAMKRERESQRVTNRQTDREHEQSATVDHGTACDHDEQCSDPSSILPTDAMRLTASCHSNGGERAASPRATREYIDRRACQVVTCRTAMFRSDFRCVSSKLFSTAAAAAGRRRDAATPRRIAPPGAASPPPAP